MTDPTTLRTELEQAFIRSMPTKFGEKPPAINLGWEEVHFPTLAKELEALYTRKLAEVEKAARIDELQEYFDAIQQTPDDYARQRLAELKTGKGGEG